MAEYGKRDEKGSPSDSPPKPPAPGREVVAVPDSLVSEFLALHGVEAAPPLKDSAMKNGFMGAAVGANPVVGGLLHVVNNQRQGSAQAEWLSWKQWALAHPDWPAFWETHKERVAKEVASNREAKPAEKPRPEIRYGEIPVARTNAKPNKPLHQKPAGLIIAILAGSLGGPAGLVASPLVLWLCSINGEKVIKKKSGKEQKIGVWAQWAAAGFIIAPTLAGLTTILSPSPAPQQVKQAAAPATFQPGVPGRLNTEVCNSNSIECQTWTSLAVKCEENMQQRDAGYMGRFHRDYCTEMEEYRERVSGVALSTDPGAYNF